MDVIMDCGLEQCTCVFQEFRTFRAKSQLVICGGDRTVANARRSMLNIIILAAADERANTVADQT